MRPSSPTRSLAAAALVSLLGAAPACSPPADLTTEPPVETAAGASRSPHPIGPDTGAAVARDPAAAPGVLARIDGDPITLEQAEPGIALQIYQRQVDIYSLLRSRTEELVDRELLRRAAAREDVTVEEYLRRRTAENAPPVSDADVDAHLAARPRDAALGDAARPRVRFYLEETRRIERRLALLRELRREAKVEILLEPPVMPRVTPDLDGAPARGPADAPVTIAHFASFDSPLSARAAGFLRDLDREFPGKLRFAHRNFLDRESEAGLIAAELAVAAAPGDRFWALHDALFARGGELSPDDARRIAAESGLDPAWIAAAIDDPDTLAALRAEIALGTSIGIPRDGTVLVNGRYFSATFPYERLRDLVMEELAASAGG